MPVKPTQSEAEYYARMEFERRKTLEIDKRAAMEVEEKKQQQELHYMRCPKCGMQLIEIDYRGIEIDKCSECEGVWLDAGELEEVSKMEKRGLQMLFSVFTGKDLKK
jgi:hypothetical protein